MFPALELELEDEDELEAADENEGIGYVGERVGEETHERGGLVALGVEAGEEAGDEEEDASSRGRNEKLRARAVGGGGGIEVRRGHGGVAGDEGIWCCAFSLKGAW